jgi:alpha-D-xyloside xylohydrolase
MDSSTFFFTCSSCSFIFESGFESIEILPLFVRAGSILPLGEPVESTNQLQKIATLRVYSGADADFEYYNDDGTTYSYEKGQFELTHLHWSDATQTLSRSGVTLNVVSEKSLIEVIGDKRSEP